jgi:citrate synthase
MSANGNTLVAPEGLAGVVVADTAVGDVRGEEGFYHYRQYSAVELAASRSFEDVWHLMVVGELPGPAEGAEFTRRVAGLRALPSATAHLLPELARLGPPLNTLRTAVSVLGTELAWPPTHDLDRATLREETLRLCAVVPTILAAAHRLARNEQPVPSRPDLSHTADYLWMLSGREPSPEAARALEQYLIVTMDHGFNSSTFAARVITSTGADLAAAFCGAVGALSGPLHGGAPSRALAMLDEIGSPGEADAWVRRAVQRGDRIMGFGHRVYRTDDPRALFLREVATGLGGPLVDAALAVERTVVDVLAELKPGRRLYTNVEFYAGVVMDACGIHRDLFTPTFAASRAVGWAANIIEQAAANRLIRPIARYVGPPAPQPVPPASPPILPAR